MTQGQILGIIGGTGSGKIVWCNFILDFIQQTRGALTFIEMDVVLLIWSSGDHGLPMCPKIELFKGSIRSNLTLGLDQEVTDQEPGRLWKLRKLRICQ